MVGEKRCRVRGGHAGVVFTPPALAARLCAPLFAATPPKRVLDPACGDGALLLAALEAAGKDPEFARRGLFGIDVDADLVRSARERVARAAGLEPGQLEGQIVCADALAEPDRWPRATHVIANPPWLSFSGRHAGRREDGRPEGAGWPALHSAFLERIAAHVAREATRARVLLPAQVTELERYGPARLAATRHCRLSRPPEELGENCFEGVVSPTVLVTLEPRRSADQASAERWTQSSSDAWLKRLADHPRLGRAAFADPGVHTGNCGRLLVSDVGGPAHAPLRVGKDLSAYRLGPASRYLRTDLEPGQERRFRIAPLERYRSYPVLIRQTASRPIAALHEGPGYFRNSLLAARPIEALDPAFIVAVLNGSVAERWHRLRWRDARQKSFPQVKVGHLASIPFPIVDRSEAPELHDEVARRARALNHTADGDAFERAEAELASIVRDAYALK